MTDKPEKPEVGYFQTAEWLEDEQQWLIRDMTEDELYRARPPYDSWKWSDEKDDWVAPEPKPDEDAEWDEENRLWIPGDEVKAANIRNKRNALLADSDWTQVGDAPTDQDAWATYRQALRDVPQQEGFPFDVIWPTKPE